MPQIEYSGAAGDFILRDADRAPGMVFPLVNAAGMISSVTSRWAGDCKTGQNSFLLPPASIETLHESRAGRNFWLRLPDGELWSAAGVSAAQQAKRYNNEETCTARGGLLWYETRRQNARLGVRADILAFVPAESEQAEMLRVTVTNESASPLAFIPTAAFPLYGRSADNIRDHRHVTSLLNRLTVTDCGVALRPTMTFDERGHKPGENTYTVCGLDENGEGPVGCLGPVEDYVGAVGWDWPQALIDDGPWLRAGERSEGYEMAAALRFAPCTLGPGEGRSWFIALGVNGDGRRFLSPAAFEDALGKTRKHWQGVGAAVFSTGDPALDGWLRWVAVQPELRRICGCSFLPHHDYGRGGRGWRDLWQDSLALILRDPAGVRGDLVSYFAGVRADGTNATIIGAKPGEFIADRNNIVRVWMDHGYWPLVTVNEYIRQSGDLGILLEKQPWFIDRRKMRGERLADEPPACSRLGESTVLEHLLVQNVTAFFDAGEHGCIRLRGADWNDALDMAAQRGESVAFTAAYAGNLHILAALCRALEKAGTKTLALDSAFRGLLFSDPAGDRNAARLRYEAVCEERAREIETETSRVACALDALGDFLTDLLRRQEFTPEGWMNSYYDNNAEPVRRMMLTGQVFALMGGAADAERADAIIRAADARLYDEKRGGYCLNENFGDNFPPLGRQFGFAYGHKENGAVFCHMSVMYAYALLSRGKTAAGLKALRALIARSMDTPVSRVYPGIPEYFDPRGRGMYPYLTGAGSWLMLSLITRVWGVQGSPEGVRFSPQLPPEWFDAQGVSSVRCMIAGREALVRCHGPGKTVARVLLDGEEVSQPLSREAIRNAKTACIDIELEG